MKRQTLEEALAILRDPDGTGRTKVSAGGLDGVERTLRCQKPTRAGRCTLDTGHDGPCRAATTKETNHE